MKVKTAFLFFVCVLFTTFCSAQQDKIDSLKKVVATAPEDSNKVNSLIKLSDKYRLVSADSAMTYANEAKALGEKINYRKGTGYALKAIGMVYNLREDYVNALQVWKEALKIFEEDSFKVGAANMLNNIGVIYYNKGLEDKALESYLKSLKYAQDANVPFTDFASLCRAREVQDLIWLEIEKVNRGFARVETIKKFRLIEHQLTAEDDELTPTMKLKRKFVNEKYKTLIDSMYQDAG